MKISMIAAMAADRVIGDDGTLPWRLPADLAHFKATTMGKPILMGRKTFESLSGPLPGRRNLVVTHDSRFWAPGIEIFHSIEQALQAVAEVAEVVVIGGGELYKAMLSQADQLYLTRINADIVGDTYFPEWDNGEWVRSTTSSHTPDERNNYHYDFECWDRIVA